MRATRASPVLLGARVHERGRSHPHFSLCGLSIYLVSNVLRLVIEGVIAYA